MKNMTYSTYQTAIFDHIKNSTNSLVISALAGSGKTTSIIESLSFIPKNKSILMLAFNKSIADELKTKVPSSVEVRTFNSLGASSIYSVVGHTNLDNQKTSKIALETNGGYKSAKMFKAIALVNHAKTIGIVPSTIKGRSFLKDTQESWDYIIDYFNVELGSCDKDEVISLARFILEDSITAVTNKKLIDFADQIYIPVIKNLPMKQYDFVFVDEMQDISRLQISMIKNSLSPKGRVVAIGDRNQAIYGFRGASTEAFDSIVKIFNCDILPLSVSYRCAKNIVLEANSIVKEMLPRDNAPEGEIIRKGAWGYRDIKPKSMVLCRNNAPLFDMAYYLIANNIPCTMLGKDGAKSLTSLISDMKATSIKNLKDKLTAWKNQKINYLNRMNRSYMIDAINDKTSCIFTVIHASKANTVKEVITQIENLFNTPVTNTTVSLCTCHKSKGLEADTVYILDEYLFPSKFAKQDWEFEQEDNLKYVAITRAKTELVFINSSNKIR